MGSTQTPSAIGARAEASVASALVRVGFEVFVPVFSAHGRLDMVYRDGGRLVGVQCKSALTVGGTLRFLTCSNTANLPQRYGDEVDQFGVYSRDSGLVYLVPNVGLPTRACFLRLTPTVNRQASGIRWAKDFELGPP